MQRYNIFLYYNTFLNFFSTIIHKLHFLYHISENEQNKDKIGTNTHIRAYLYIAKIEIPCRRHKIRKYTNYCTKSD